MAPLERCDSRVGSRPRRPDLWRRCDPRSRLLATALASLAALTAGSWAAIGTALAAVALLHAMSGTGTAAALASLQPFRLLLLFAAAAHLGSTAGGPLFSGAVTAALTVDGCSAAAAAAARLAGVIAAAAHLARTTSTLELAGCLGWCVAPAARLGLPVREATLVMALGLYFFPVLLDESREIRDALESRGITAGHHQLAFRARACAALTFAVLFGVVDRSARLAAALQARGFCVGGGRVSRFRPWRFESSLLVLANLALCGLAAALSRGF